MDEQNFWNGFTFAFITIIVIITIFVSIATYIFHDLQNANPLITFAIKNHLAIMIITMIILLLYGYFSSNALKQKINQQTQSTQDTLDLLINFLSREEKAVLRHLIEEDGKSTQAKIAHLNNMGGVKALRTVQKMQEKELLVVQKEGKVRRIYLQQKIYLLLKEKTHLTKL